MEKWSILSGIYNGNKRQTEYFAPMSEESAPEPPSPDNQEKAKQSVVTTVACDHPPEDPLGIGNGARGIGLLIAVCSILWAVAKFGPQGAEWIEVSLRKMAGFEGVAKSSTPEASKNASAASTTSPPVLAPAEPIISNPRNLFARKQLLEALGGPENAAIQHLSFSQDETMMVAAVKFLNPPEGQPDKAEIYFELDELDRYVSTQPSTLPEAIKIYKPE